MHGLFRQIAVDRLHVPVRIVAHRQLCHGVFFAHAQVEGPVAPQFVVMRPVIGDVGVEAGLASEVHLGRPLPVFVLNGIVAVRVIELRVFVDRKPVFRQEGLDHPERGRNTAVGNAHGVVRKPADGIHLLAVHRRAGIDPDHVRIVRYFAGKRRHHVPGRLVGDLLRRERRSFGLELEQFVSLLLRGGYRFLGCVEGHFPFLLVVGLTDELLPVLVLEIGVVLRIAVEKRAGGIEQHPRLDGQSGDVVGTAHVQRRVGPRSLQFAGCLVEFSGDPAYAFVVGPPGRVVDLFRSVVRNDPVDEADGTVEPQERIVEIGDQEFRLGFPPRFFTIAGVGNSVHHVDEGVALADAPVEVVGGAA